MIIIIKINFSHVGYTTLLTFLFLGFLSPDKIDHPNKNHSIIQFSLVDVILGQEPPFFSLEKLCNIPPSAEFLFYCMIFQHLWKVFFLFISILRLILKKQSFVSDFKSNSCNSFWFFVYCLVFPVKIWKRFYFVQS